MKIVLLAPPGQRRYVRDYYCSKVAKANYSYSPVDLLFLSGRFKNLAFIDAIQERLSPAACLERIKTEVPGAIISLVSSVSWLEDKTFLTQVKRTLPKTLILASGDVLREGGEELLAREPWLDAIILDFTNADAARFLLSDMEGLEQMILRDGSFRILARLKKDRPGLIENLPQPRHELFLAKGYAYPFVRQRHFATVQTDFGCPFNCRFCVMGSLGHRVRPEEEVVAELKYLQNLGIREIYFNDQTFGGTPERLARLCRVFIEAELNLGWCCWNRVDLVSEHLKLLKAAGCHTILFGVDSADETTLRHYRKGYSLVQVRQTFAACRRLGIRTLGTFLLGLPGENQATIERTVNLALELDPDFVSFNVFTPRKGTAIRAELAQEGKLPGDEVVLDQTGAIVNYSRCGLDPTELKVLRDKAVRRFYLRPGYVLRRLKGIKTSYDLEVLFRTALSMVW